jgi:hypothetical protein
MVRILLVNCPWTSRRQTPISWSRSVTSPTCQRVTDRAAVELSQMAVREARGIPALRSPEVGPDEITGFSS